MQDWTEKEKQIIKNNCHLPLDEWRHLLKRTDVAIFKKAKRLGIHVHFHAETTLEQEFWKRVLIRDKDECWLWKGGQNLDGYGIFFCQGKTFIASRFSWKLHFGEIPYQDGKDKLFVCHKCDNPPCVNPDHLFLGTCADNVQDMIKKDRHTTKPKSERQMIEHQKKIEQVKIELRKGIKTVKDIAKEYNIKYAEIWKLAEGIIMNP